MSHPYRASGGSQQNPVRRVSTSSSANPGNRKPSPLRQSFRLKTDGSIEENETDTEISIEQNYHLSLQYKDLYKNVHEHSFQDEELSKKYKRKNQIMELILTVALIVPLIASVLTTINANYKNVGLAIASGVVGAVATSTIAILNGIRSNFKFLQTAQFYHDRATKMAEIQDTISVAISLRTYDNSEFFEQSARFDLLKSLPVGSDITGTSNLTMTGKMSEINSSNRGTPLRHLPLALEKQILAIHSPVAVSPSSPTLRERTHEILHHRRASAASPAPLSPASQTSQSSYNSFKSINLDSPLQTTREGHQSSHH